MKEKGLFSNVEEYISLYPAPVRKELKLLRKTIQQAAPGAEELISYQMPAYKLNGMLVFFAATKTHYGFYPTSSPIRAFKEKLKGYETSKGTIKFPLSQPIPAALITKIVKFRIKENLKSEKLKAKK